MKTPRHILEAVTRYHEGDSSLLIKYFNEGVPLQKYKETREIVINGIHGKSSRTVADGTKLTRDEIAIREQAVFLAAQLKGAGKGLHSAGGNSKPTACSIAGEVFGLSAGTVYQAYQNIKNSDLIQEHIEIGEITQEALLEIYP